jgi:hypothetical protein
VVDFKENFICGNGDAGEINEKIIKFLGGDIVVVTAVVGSLNQVKCIVSQYESEERTFAFIKVSKEGYLLVREVEPDYVYKSPVTGEEILMSDYTYDNKVRGIVSTCPDGELIRCWLKGEPVYFKRGN